MKKVKLKYTYSINDDECETDKNTIYIPKHIISNTNELLIHCLHVINLLTNPIYSDDCKIFKFNIKYKVKGTIINIKYKVKGTIINIKYKVKGTIINIKYNLKTT